MNGLNGCRITLLSSTFLFPPQTVHVLANKIFTRWNRLVVILVESSYCCSSLAIGCRCGVLGLKILLGGIGLWSFSLNLLTVVVVLLLVVVVVFLAFPLFHFSLRNVDGLVVVPVLTVVDAMSLSFRARRKSTIGPCR